MSCVKEKVVRLEALQGNEATETFVSTNPNHFLSKGAKRKAVQEKLKQTDVSSKLKI